MRSRGIVLAITAAFLVLATWLALRPAPSPMPGGRGVTATGTPVVTQTGEVIPSAIPPSPGETGSPVLTTGTPAAGRAAPPTAARGNGFTPAANVSPATAAERESALVEVGKVRRMIVDYHTLMGENPVGTNAEIMHALMGGNAHQAMLGPPEGQTLNDKGELIDPWGTPYFFHQLSRDRMEVRSAGPDRIMGTPDDVVVK